MPLPTLALIGRPNVGKSTLFNQLTKTQDALVADFPGLTRDRQYGLGKVGDFSYWVIDTGGIGEPTSAEAVITEGLERQVHEAIKSADHIFFLLDAKVGLTTADEQLANLLRICSDKLTVVVNKADHEELELIKADFYALGFARIQAISAIRGRGVAHLIEQTKPLLPESHETFFDNKEAICVAIVGRPNVGKSTLINALLGEERVVVSDIPGTTRDSIAVPFRHLNTDYVLVDTAGVRRRSKIKEPIEQDTIWQTIKAIDVAEVIILVIDARAGVTDQDMRLVQLIISRGRGLVFAFNKWDGMEEIDKTHFKESIDQYLPFATFARRYFISAKHGTGIGKLYYALNESYESSNKELNTGFLTQVLNQALEDHQPPLVRGRRIRLRMAHIAARHPLTILVHGKQTEAIPQSYQRYLSNYFRKACDLMGIPLILRFKTDDNPYDKKENNDSRKKQ
jgi:GTP-binding protein